MPRFIFHDGQMVEVPYAKDLPRQPSVFPTVRGDLAPYKSPLGTGWVDGRRARREEMARHDVREVDPSEYRPTAWNPANALKYGLQHEPQPETPEHVKKWQAGKLVQREAVQAAPATPEMRQAAAAEAIRTAETKK